MILQPGLVAGDIGSLLAVWCCVTLLDKFMFGWIIAHAATNHAALLYVSMSHIL
jgi:hypothetical protein